MYHKLLKFAYTNIMQLYLLQYAIAYRNKDCKKDQSIRIFSFLLFHEKEELWLVNSLYALYVIQKYCDLKEKVKWLMFTMRSILWYWPTFPLLKMKRERGKEDGDHT